jgi:hypothetical protein
MPSVVYARALVFFLALDQQVLDLLEDHLE